LTATGLETNREVVEAGLRAVLRLSRQSRIPQLRGKLVWHGVLEAMRTGR
jgi:hypothetical protein